MPKRDSGLTGGDGFCGCGGSSEGLVEAAKELGINDFNLKAAMNHWRVAIDTHQENFPNTDHYCTDLSAADPRWFPSTDIHLWSPECTNQSPAKGKAAVKAQMDMFTNGTIDPSAERSRATMWEVPRFAEYHDYPLIVVENVVEARKWKMYHAWIMAMRSLGYLHRVIYFNSMFAWPTPQSRDRMYVVFWKAGNEEPDLEFNPLAYCEKCEHDVESVQTWKKQDVRYGKYNQQYVYCCPRCAIIVKPYYYAAFNCIDWNIEATKIGDRKKPLADNTMNRIKYGRERYGNRPLYIYIPPDAGNFKRAHELTSNPLKTFTSQLQYSLYNPLFVNTAFTHAGDKRTTSSIEVLRAQTTKNASGILVQPFMVNNNNNSYASGIDEALKGFTTKLKTGIMLPYIVHNKGTGTAKSVVHPLYTQCTVRNDGIISHESVNQFLGYYRGMQASHIADPAFTFPTHDSHFLVGMPGELPPIEECTYRMLHKNEVKKGMAFRDNYIITGNQENCIKQLGNAVTPPVMKMITKRCLQTLL